MHAITAEILPFRRPPPPPSKARFTCRDKIALAGWESQVDRLGLTRVVIESGAEQGDFALIYRAHSPWAAYGVGAERDHYIAWQQTTGATIGVFGDIAAALDAVAGHRVGSLPVQA